MHGPADIVTTAAVSPHLDAVCANCRRILIPIEDRDAEDNTLRVHYHHPQALPGVVCDNLEPIFFNEGERSPISAVTVCDFCGVAGVDWEYPAVDHGVQGDPHMVMCGAWVACDACHRDIEAKAWNRMAERWFQVHQRTANRLTRMHFISVYRGFEAHRTGPAVQLWQ